MADTFSLDPGPAGLAEVAGFRTGAAACGLGAGGPDIGVLVCESPEGAGTAVFTQGALRAAPVSVSAEPVMAGRLRAAVVNAGCANCFTGADGERDAREMVSLAASGLDLPPEQVLAASCGPSGRPLPMQQVGKGVEDACRDAREGGSGDFACAIASTGGACSATSASGTIDGKPFRIAGVARGWSPGSGDMAAVFAFIVTDVAIAPDCLLEVLTSAHERTFGRLTADAGAGTNDTVCILASCQAGNEIIDNIFSVGAFAEALEAVAGRLATGAGEAATRRIEVRVSGAADEREARLACQSIARSVAVRAAVAAGDPNWGPVLTAAANGEARVDPSLATVRFGGEDVYERGRPVDPPPEGLAEKIGAGACAVELDLGLGDGSATVWTCALPVGGGKRLDLAERAAEEAKAAAAETRDRLERSEKERASLEAARAELEAKLKESESAREAASRESEERARRLGAAERSAGEAKAAAEAIVKEAREAATAQLEILVKKLEETEAARASAVGEAEALREELAVKLREAATALEVAARESEEGARRLEAAERAAAEAGTAVATGRKELEAKLKEAESARAASTREADELREQLEQARTEAVANADAGRRELAAKLKEAESAREAASREAEERAKRLEAAERAAGEAGAAAATGRKELEAKLKEAESAAAAGHKELETKLKEAEAAAAAGRKELETKLREAESAREAASREAEELRGRLQVAEETAEKTADKASAKQALKKAKDAAAAERKESAAKLKEANAARKAAEKQAKALTKLLEDGQKTAAAAAEKETAALRAELDGKTKEVAELRSRAEQAEAAAAGAARYRQEAEKAAAEVQAAEVKVEKTRTDFSLKEQLLKQLLDEEAERRKCLEEHKALVRKVEELQSELDAARGKAGDG